MKTQKKPTFTAQFGSIRLSIWATDTKAGPMLSATITRRYQTKDGAWSSSSSFVIGELDSVIEAAETARRWIAENTANLSNGANPASLEEDAPW